MKIHEHLYRSLDLLFKIKMIVQKISSMLQFIRNSSLKSYSSLFSKSINVRIRSVPEQRQIPILSRNSFSSVSFTPMNIVQYSLVDDKYIAEYLQEIKRPAVVSTCT